jgi:hypothetical protein
MLRRRVIRIGMMKILIVDGDDALQTRFHQIENCW